MRKVRVLWPGGKSRASEVPRSHVVKDRAAGTNKVNALPLLPKQVCSAGAWRMVAAVSQRMSVGRVHLLGDAAHQFPPAGEEAVARPLTPITVFLAPPASPPTPTSSHPSRFAQVHLA